MNRDTKESCKKAYVFDGCCFSRSSVWSDQTGRKLNKRQRGIETEIERYREKQNEISEG